jgi:hypothetical protein
MTGYRETSASASTGKTAEPTASATTDSNEPSDNNVPDSIVPSASFPPTMETNPEIPDHSKEFQQN